MNEQMTKVLESLRSNVESFSGDWGSVYLDNIWVKGLSESQIYGYLSQLEKLGLYRTYAYGFGEVKVA